MAGETAVARRVRQHTAACVTRACRDVAAALQVIRTECATSGFARDGRDTCRELVAAGLRDALRRLDGWLADDALDDLSRRRCLAARHDALEICALLEVSA
ncbi:MAG: hypothetical protein ABR520_00670 [Mycobacteriales bacterium]